LRTFEIKGLVGYRLDRVDTTGEGTTRGTPRHGCELVVFCRRMYQWYVWWIHGACLACLSSWWPTRKTVASRLSLDWLHVPAKQLPTRAPVLPSRSHRTRATAMETNRKRKASDDGLREAKARPPSQVACARRQAQVEYVQLAGCASRHRATLELRPVRCAYPHAVRLLLPLSVGWVRGHRPHRQHQAAVLPAKLPAVLCNAQFHEGFHRPPCLPPSRASNRIVAHGRHIRIQLL
jgi:hypothetical protein